MMAEQLDRIEAKLDDLIAWKEETNAWRARLDERCRMHRQQTTEHHNVLFDNPGIRSKVDRLWNCKTDLSDQRTLIRNFIMGVLKIVTATAIIVLIGWFLLLYKGK